MFKNRRDLYVNINVTMAIEVLTKEDGAREGQFPIQLALIPPPPWLELI